MKRLAYDRAALAATAIMQMVATAPEKELQRAIEDYSRDQFSKLKRQIAAERSADNA
jgi:hypothetical protein